MPGRALPRVTILMTSAGGGHLASSQALEEAFAGRAKVTLLNLLDEHAPFPFDRLSDSYAPVVAIAPDLYRLAYKVVQTKMGVRMLERGGYGLLGDDMARAISATKPDLVMSVHALLVSTPLRAMRASGISAPFVATVVDAGSPPVQWFAKGADLYCVPDEDVRKIAIGHGIPPRNVLATGLPIRRQFAEARGMKKADARRRLGVEPHLPLVLVTGGGAGMGDVGRVATAIARRLTQAGRPAQIVIITGSNERMRRRLEVKEWPLPVTVLGFTDRMAAWMASADVLLTKAGPGTIAEAACLGVPTVLTGFVPGQEEPNVGWAQRNGGAVFEPEPRRAAAVVERWLRPGSRDLAERGMMMTAMGSCEAASRIAEASLMLLRR